MDVEFSEPPAPIPKPSLWKLVLVIIWDLGVAALFFQQAGKVFVFFSGVFASVAGMQVAFAVLNHRHWRELQTNLDEMWEQAKLRMTMLPRLVERHGPEAAIEIMQAADHLVGEGDFTDLHQAVAAIERHHDMEPTDFESSASD